MNTPTATKTAAQLQIGDIVLIQHADDGSLDHETVVKIQTVCLKPKLIDVYTDQTRVRVRPFDMFDVKTAEVGP